MSFDLQVLIALSAGFGSAFLTWGGLRWSRRKSMQQRLQSMSFDWVVPATGQPAASLGTRSLAGRLGARLGQRLPNQVGLLATRLDRAGLAGGITTLEVLGWKVVGVVAGALVGLWGITSYGTPGLLMLILGVLFGWFGIDVVLARIHGQRRLAILRDLPTMMDLLVLSLEAGMGLDRALRTVVREYHSPLATDIQRVLGDMDLGVSRGEAFERMAARVGLDDLHALSRALVQSEELGVSIIGVMQNQSREVRLSRRREAEAQALRAPIKMLIPLVVFILPTLFLLLLGPVGLRASEAIGGASP